MEPKRTGEAGGPILVGVAGWSYADWRGSFYPLRKEPRSDLARIARTFDCVEINVAFYRVPDAAMAEGWLRAVRDRPGFLFTTKVPKELTHGKDADPAGLRAGAASLREGLAPLVEAGRLGAVLLQFPFWFRDGPASRVRIERLVEAFHTLPVTVEVRHRSFFGDPGDGLAFLRKVGAGLVNIDIPSGRGTVPPTAIVTSPTGYVRLHGRNGRAWFDPKAGRDAKYDYLYTPAELAEWKERIEAVGRGAARTFVIANNHFKAQAPANAIELLHLLGRTPADIPRELLEAYPEVARRIGRGIPVQPEIPGLWTGGGPS